jgi:hypothetical protein
MNWADRIVTEIPICEMWDCKGLTLFKREKNLSKEEISFILKNDFVQFIVADVGKPLKWIPSNESFSFWKNTVAHHLPDNYEKIELEKFPDNYAFIASQWSIDSKRTIIVLEKIH